MRRSHSGCSRQGCVDRDQLERGTVRVGDVEHLGRLFDRDATVDRDAVMVVTETATQAIVAEIANEAICTVRSTAYRHHPSGLHRWFATPLDTAHSSRPWPVARRAHDRRRSGPSERHGPHPR